MSALAANANGRPEANFADLVAGSGGRHPIELYEALKAREDRSAHDDSLLTNAGLPHSPTWILPQGEGLPLPHPLDAEWRFATETSEALLARAIDATKPGAALLLLGVPTVVLSALRSRVQRRFVVHCEDNVIGSALHARTASDPRFVLNAPEGCAAAVLDPPWYPKVFDALVGRAALACQEGALIFVGAPSSGVRPAMAAERAKMLATAEVSGLSLAGEDPSWLRYRTPAFELAAMRAAGVGAWLPAWRQGDLLTFQKSSIGEAPPVPRARPAFELTLDGVRLRLLASPAPLGSQMLPIVAGEVFPSVSARAPGREAANLWTSGNRAFVCDPSATLAALQRLAAERGLWPKGLDSARKGGRDSASIDAIQLVDELAAIAARDLAQAVVLVGESSWDRNANDARFLNGSSSAFHQSLLGTLG